MLGGLIQGCAVALRVDCMLQEGVQFKGAKEVEMKTLLEESLVSRMV
jgi:hypothetical protein